MDLLYTLVSAEVLPSVRLSNALSMSCSRPPFRSHRASLSPLRSYASLSLSLSLFLSCARALSLSLSLSRALSLSLSLASLSSFGQKKELEGTQWAGSQRLQDFLFTAL